MLNKTMLTGRLVNDPTLRHTSAGTPVTNITVQTQASHRDQFGSVVNSTPWIKVVAYKELAIDCTTTLRKGTLVYVEGSLHTHKWRDPHGVIQNITEIDATRIMALEADRQESEPPLPQQAS
jgi:single-strand DNA-binding protein